MNLSKGWQEILEKEQSKDYYKNLRAFLLEEYKTKIIYPPKDKVFTALELTPLEDVKVVILGQDPYHGPNQAHGLAFSVEKGIAVPKSLQNIYKEIHRTEGHSIPKNGNLESWAKQGVLLLNTVFTVRSGEANSHQKQGWEIFTDELIKAVNQKDTPVIFLLWGRAAISKKELITNPIHKILTTTHPSPLSASRGFTGCGHFQTTNELLINSNQIPIDWKIEE